MTRQKSCCKRASLGPFCFLHKKQAEGLFNKNIDFRVVKLYIIGKKRVSYQTSFGCIPKQIIGEEIRVPWPFKTEPYPPFKANVQCAQEVLSNG
ncbi:hypothetical protein HMPREF0262_00962 [Clostridium sp. ATCC 29733]|nr:hypothetical protein HMPREF0262_00962 [Clostridium sp. ATCC 29733]